MSRKYELKEEKGVNIKVPIGCWHTIPEDSPQAEQIKEVTADVMDISPEPNRQFVMFTGLKGADDFDVAMSIEFCRPDFDSLANKYRKARNDLHNTKQKLHRIESSNLIKFLMWLKVIK